MHILPTLPATVSETESQVQGTLGPILGTHRDVCPKSEPFQVTQPSSAHARRCLVTAQRQLSLEAAGAQLYVRNRILVDLSFVYDYIGMLTRNLSTVLLTRVAASWAHFSPAQPRHNLCISPHQPGSVFCSLMQLTRRRQPLRVSTIRS